MRSENTNLRSEQEEFRSKLSVALAEKEALEKKMNSVFELKKAIKALHKKIRFVVPAPSERTQADPRVMNQEEPRVMEGNRGFLVKDGKATYPVKVKIEVTQTQTAQ